MCLYPKFIDNRKYKANKKNGGVIPAVIDKRVLVVPVGCGKCIECKRQKSKNWSVRLQEELKNNVKGYFVTLTMSDESIEELRKDIKLEGYELDNEIAKKGTRRFLERWRKKYKKSVKHWLVTELGHKGTENIHMHGIIWTDKPAEEIKNIWKYGYVWIGEYVNEKTINYIVKYITKTDLKHENYNSKVLCSPGIGSKYTNRLESKNNKFKGKDTIETYRCRNGAKIALPIYYRNKIYSEEEREKLWLQKLDEEKRYILGMEIDISKNEDSYYKILNEARMKNKRLGYGNDEKDWDKIRYERERRNKLYKERQERNLAKR